MTSLMMEIAAWLAGAAALGAVTGFLACRAFARPTSAPKDEPAPASTPVDDGVVDERDQLLERMREELDEMRKEHRATEERLLQFESLDKEASAVLVSQIETQLDDIRRERDMSHSELDSLRERNRQLQHQLNESADRIVQLERARIEARPKHDGPILDPAAHRKDTSREVPVHPTTSKSPAGASGADSLVFPEAGPVAVEELGPRSAPSAPYTTGSDRVEDFEGSPVALHVERTTPLPMEDRPVASQATGQQRHTAPTNTGPSEPDSGDPPASAGATLDNVGSERDLVEVTRIPPAEVERLRLIGVTTNLALLRKAGGINGRKALSASTRITMETLLEWVRQADLMRVGLRSEDLGSLFDAGVRTVAQLGKSEADKLTERLLKRASRTQREKISHDAVERWIVRANELTPMVEE